MKLPTLLIINAIAAIAIGLAFALYGPIMMAFFGVPEQSSLDALDYWMIASFARMFGAALFGFGLLLWAIRKAISDVSAQSRRSIVFALLLANLIGVFVSLTQQAAIWQAPVGWLIAAFFAFFTLTYAFFLVRKA